MSSVPSECLTNLACHLILSSTLRHGAGEDRFKVMDMENVVTDGQSRDDNIKGQGVRGPDSEGHFSTMVNGVIVKFSEAMPKGEHILEKADLKPASDYVLIQIQAHSSRSVCSCATCRLSSKPRPRKRSRTPMRVSIV